MTPGPLDLTLWRGATFGPVVVTCLDGAGAAVNLTGWSAFADVRVAAGKRKVLDLQPAILVGTDGKVTIPGFTDEQTTGLPHGSFVWDLILEQPAGERLGPILAGSFVIKTAVTRA